MEQYGVSFSVSVVWSEPVSVSCQGSSEQFVRVPGHGDVRIRMTPASGRTTLVHIECVSRIEISAKEIRARLQPSSQQHQEITMLSSKAPDTKQNQEQWNNQDNNVVSLDTQQLQSTVPPVAQNKTKQHIFVTVYAASVQVDIFK